jgi:F-type H+-transporting ATPase subunit b
MFDEKFWLAVSFLLVVALVFKSLRAIILTGLDKRAQRIKQELEEVYSLREQAVKTLEEFKLKQKESECEVKKIVENAEKEVERMRSSAQKELEFYLSKKTSMVIDRIATNEDRVIRELREGAIENAVSVVSLLVSEGLNEKTAENLSANFIQNLPKRIH